MLYLIMGCHELNDQYECDVKRYPVALTENWKQHILNHPEFTADYEVYEWNGETMICIKRYDESDRVLYS